MTTTVSWVEYRKAYNFLSSNTDSAFYYFNRVASTSHDRQQVATAYYCMSTLQQAAGDIFGSQESLSLSLKFLNEHKTADHPLLARNFNELGVTSYDLKNYNEAIVYYKDALRYTDDPSLLPYILNNLGNAFQKKKEYQQALKFYHEVLTQKGLSEIAYARTLSNMARTKWLENSHYQPLPQFHEALKIRLKKGDLFGENASYAHLTEYYEKSSLDSARDYAQLMYKVATKLNSPDDRLEALDKLTQLGRRDEFKYYFASYRRLEDSLQAARSAAKNQFALIRYNAEKNKVENLRLQKDNSEKRYQLIRQQFFSGAIILLFILSLVTGFLWFKKRKHTMKEEANAALRQNELRLSRKVHDVVANRIYRVMNEVEHGKFLDKNVLLDQLEQVYEQSRDISYDRDQEVAENFSDHINVLLNAFKSKMIKVAVTGNDSGLWKKVNETIKLELETVLQELMVNMTKHSRANLATLKFKYQDGDLLVDYQDDGVGPSADLSYGNGLHNMVSRIEALKGSLKFDARPDKGFCLQIIIPVK